jgi:ketosteroid isomerase-like protein
MSDTQIRALCHALFDALERGDVAAVDRCYAPGMTMWFNVTGTEITRDENLDAIGEGKALHRRRTYNDRQIRTFGDGFVAQYTLNITLLDGSTRALWACLVGEVHDGLIVRLDEYLDSGKFRPAERRATPRPRARSVS